MPIIYNYNSNNDNDSMCDTYFCLKFRDEIRERVNVEARKQLDDMTRYHLPACVGSELEKRLPNSVDAYLMNHRMTQQLLEKVEEKVNTSTRSVMDRITNDDPAQNAVFGAFMKNQERKCSTVLRNTQSEIDRKLQNMQDNADQALIRIRDTSTDRIRSLENLSFINTLGWMGALGVGIYSIFWR